jgi:hypothetical protein
MAAATVGDQQLRPDPMIFTGLLIPSIVRQANGVDMR